MEYREIDSLEEEDYRQLEGLSGLNYTIRRIEIIMGLKPGSAHLAINDSESEFSKRYEKGQLTYQSKIDFARLNSALQGNLTAIQQYENKKNITKLNDMKYELFGI